MKWNTKRIKKKKSLKKTLLKNFICINNSTKGKLILKTYSELLEAIKKPDGKKVFDKKIKRIPVQVYKERMRTNPFVAYVDGDRLMHSEQKRMQSKRRNRNKGINIDEVNYRIYRERFTEVSH